MSGKVLIDVGSSTIKVNHVSEAGDVQQLETKSIHFKDSFDPERGITKDNQKQLIDYITTIQDKYKLPCKVYATAIFRKMSLPVRKKLIDDFFSSTGLFFNIVSHDLEAHYLEHALAGKNTAKDTVLLINIGGGSTELIVMKGVEVQQRLALEIGVMNILAAFPHLNDSTSGHELDDVVQYVRQQLPEAVHKVRWAIYNGGELSYMKRASYKLVRNTLQADENHPLMIKVSDFKARNKEIFHKVTIGQLEAMMPEDPLWMHGARSCSAIAQAIVQHYGIQTIIPSDSNMIHGVVRKEHRQVVLSGSFRKHLDHILELKKQLEAKGINVLSPRFKHPKNPHDEFVVFDGEEGLSPLELERYHLDKIEKCDALIVCAPDGYVGASAMLEIGYAQALGKRIIFSEKPSEFMLNTMPSEVGI